MQIYCCRCRRKISYHRYSFLEPKQLRDQYRCERHEEGFQKNYCARCAEMYEKKCPEVKCGRRLKLIKKADRI